MAHRAAMAQNVVLEALDDVPRAARAQQREEKHPQRLPRATVALQHRRRVALRENRAVRFAQRHQI